MLLEIWRVISCILLWGSRMFKKTGITLGIFLVLILLAAGLDKVNAADYSTNIFGEGSISSYTNFDDYGSTFRTSEGNYSLGILKKGDTFSSGVELLDSSDGNYGFWGIIGNRSHSFTISKASEIYAVSTLQLEEKNVYDSVGQITESYLGGQSKVNATFIGYGVEKIRGVKEDCCSGSKPIELGTKRMMGTIQITSEMVV